MLPPKLQKVTTHFSLGRISVLLRKGVRGRAARGNFSGVMLNGKASFGLNSARNADLGRGFGCANSRPDVTDSQITCNSKVFGHRLGNIAKTKC